MGLLRSINAFCYLMRKLTEKIDPQVNSSNCDDIYIDTRTFGKKHSNSFFLAHVREEFILVNRKQKLSIMNLILGYEITPSSLRLSDKTNQSIPNFATKQKGNDYFACLASLISAALLFRVTRKLTAKYARFKFINKVLKTFVMLCLILLSWFISMKETPIRLYCDESRKHVGANVLQWAHTTKQWCHLAFCSRKINLIEMSSPK